MMASSLDSATKKLSREASPFPLKDLPQTRDDPLWSEIKSEYELTLAELSSLKNHACPNPANMGFFVGATVIGAKQSNGARGNVFKFLERHRGHYSKQEGIQIVYEGDDLTVKIYFKKYEDACDFQTCLNQWEIHKQLANLRGVEIDPLTPAQVPAPSDLERIRLQDYHPQESESPCQTLDQLHSYHLSVPVTEPVEPNSELTRYQSIDKLLPHLGHYKCHLKDKAKFQKLKNNEDNMVAASWPFHQLMDGLNTHEGIPLVVMSVKSASEHRKTAHENRYTVILLLEFFYPELAASFAAIEGARSVGESSWETAVHVRDKQVFGECVAWKCSETKKKWDQHRRFLEDE